MPSEHDKSRDMPALHQLSESNRKGMKRSLPENSKFWLQVSQPSLNIVWDNTDDDVYEQLLKK